MNITEKIAGEIGGSETAVANVIRLLDDGSTIPFIARYRKEMHGSMDDASLRKIEERLRYLRNLETRKAEILHALEEQEKLTPALKASVEQAETLSEAEEIYRPYKQKRRTRATVAKEKGLEPLADELFAGKSGRTPEEAARDYICSEKGVETEQDALSGASDIIAERIAELPEIRRKLRNLARSGGRIRVKGAKKEESVYSLYYDFSCPVSGMQGYQILAVNRGEKEGFLKVSLELDEETAVSMAMRSIPQAKPLVFPFVFRAVTDGYERLILPSLTNEIRSELSEKACDGAIRTFAMNLKPLLMQRPVRGKVIMGLDPGYRMGCKVAVVDPTGKVLDTAVVYPTMGKREEEEAILKLGSLIRKHNVAHIAIGNGTASRETEKTVIELIRDFPGVTYMVVSEAGASVYSVSEIAAEEFPQYEANVRSAVSIARRLQDPLSELVKIDPKAIGVGQYQHDMPQKQLEGSLDAVVEDCVNAVGVELNTASWALLRHISGLSTAAAKSVVQYRETEGMFTERKQILSVPKIGPKAYEQCAGFLRVPESGNVLDNTGIHPESYSATKKLLKMCGCSLEDVRSGNLGPLEDRIREMGEKTVADGCGIGVPTLRDIVVELNRPGRDPRETLPEPLFRTDLLELEDIRPGMTLRGTVRNVTDFGAFVDIGVHQDGLVHISEIADRFIKHPGEVLSPGDEVKVSVLDVDTKKKRISLSIRRASSEADIGR